MSATPRADTPRLQPPPPPPPPPLPPLPPPKYGARAATAIARLAQPFFYGSRPSSAHGHRGDDGGLPAFRSGIPRSSGSSSFHSLDHKTGIPIAALDISPDRTHAILAGHNILETVKIQGETCSEDFNLRTTIAAYASTHNSSKGAVSAQHKDQLAADDVKWSHGQHHTTIATAATNGRIVLYDINRAGVELARLHEHTRKVHRVSFNPHQGALLLSGSQDATIRMWDLRDLAGDRSVMTCRSIHQFSGHNEGIRDVQWSPTDGVEFAAGTDNGSVQRWDFRKQNAPLLKITAHDKTCHSIDWHPSGKFIATAGADRLVKVWDFKSMDRRMRPSWQLRAPQGVLNVRWRPIGRFSEVEDNSNPQCTFLATSYIQFDPRIHIWDFRRPHVPYKEIDRNETPATGLLWCSNDLLWSVDMAGTFTQTNMNYVPNPIERRNINIIATAPDGQISFFSKARARKPLSLADAPTGFLRRTNTGGSSAENIGSSRSGTDGSLEEAGMLSSSLKKRRQKTMSAKAIGGTPPQASGNNAATARLEEAMNSEGKFHYDQVATTGYVLGVFDVNAFRYLAGNYKPPMSKSTSEASFNLHETIPKVFQENAVVAAHTGQYRLAQSWRILSLAVQKELAVRAENSMQCREHPDLFVKDNVSPVSGTGNVEIKRASDAQRLKDQSPATSNFESTSNMPTPLAKPVQESSNSSSTSDDVLDLNEKPSTGMLGPAWKSRQIHDPNGSFSEKDDVKSHGPFHSNLSAPVVNLGMLVERDAKQHDIASFGNFADIDREMHERRAAMNNYKARPRPILMLDGLASTSLNLSVKPRLYRHDSDDSFQMFSASSGSGPRSMSLAGSFGESHKSNTSDPLPEQWDSSPTARVVHDPVRESYQVGQSPPDSASVFDVNLSHAELTALGQKVLTGADPDFSVIRRLSIFIPPVVQLRRSMTSHEENALEGLNPTTSFIPTDFKASLSPTVYPLPWSATALLPPLLEFHLNALSDTQLPTFLTLYLNALFPSSFDDNTATATMLSYHQQLVSLDLYIEAAALRNYCYPEYLEIWERGIGDNQAAGFYCMSCAKAVKGDISGLCQRCNQHWGPCSVCELRNSPFQVPVFASEQNNSKEQGEHLPLKGTSLWAWCQECGHGGHDSCLRVWWSDPVSSEGACPCQGCLCDCMPGLRRDEKLKQLAAEAKRVKLKAGGVVKDAWVVGESKAVERTRGLVAPDGKPIEVVPMSRGLSGKKVRLVERMEDGVADIIDADDQGFEEETSRSER